MAADKSAYIRLRNVDNSFQTRSDCIFEGLGNLEPTRDTSDVGSNEKSAEKVNTHKKKKRNSPRSTRRHPAQVPQHVLSPEKWTKYSLESDGSERYPGTNAHALNKHAAHSFLADLKRRKTTEGSDKHAINFLEDTAESNKTPVADLSTVGPESKTCDISDVSVQKSEANSEKLNILNDGDDAKISFVKPKPKMGMTSSSDALGAWKHGTYVMPEYIVGASPSRVTPKPSKSPAVKPVTGNEQVNLEHLGGDCGDNASAMKEQEFSKHKAKRVFRKRKIDCEEEQDEASKQNTD